MRLYKFRSGRIVNLEQIRCVVQPEQPSGDTVAVIVFDTAELKITEAEYDELIVKCERYVN